MCSAALALHHFSALANQSPKPLIPRFSGERLETRFSTPQGCFAALSREVIEEGDNTRIVLKGSLSLSLLQKIIPVSLEGTMYFNSLGQLTASFARVETEEVTIGIGTTQITPIIVEITLDQKGTQIVHKLPLPGPLLLKRLPQQEYALSYPHLQIIELPILTRLSTIVERFPLDIIQDSGSCTENSQTSLPADNLIAEVLKQLLPLATSLRESGVL